MKSLKEHRYDIEKIKNNIKANRKDNRKLRFDHGSTNATRKKVTEKYHTINISNLNKIIEINPNNKEITLEPGVKMFELVEECLKFGLIPPVVPEFKEITAGGAILGGALESSSFKFGQFGDSCIELDIIDGDGNLIKTSKSKNSDLFYGIQGSYGSLGLLTLIKLKLIETKPYVKLEICTCTDLQSSLMLIKEKTFSNSDFIDGIIYKNKIVVLTGTFSQNALSSLAFSKRFDEWFYKYIDKKSNLTKNEIAYIPIKEYLFRYDRGAFWMGDYAFKILKMPLFNSRICRGVFNHYFTTKELYSALHLSNYFQEFFIQDIYFPFDNAINYLKWNKNKLNIYPIWLCPIKAVKNPQKLSPHYIKDTLLLNIGIWGQSKVFLTDYLLINKNIEKLASQNKARKMLYSQQYYTPSDFWKIYSKKWYDNLRKKYHMTIFPDIYEKTFVSEKYNPNIFKGFLNYHKLKLKKFISNFT